MQAKKHDKLESIKWTNPDGTRYEVYSDQLSLELKELLPHCLNVRSKVLKVVNVNAHKGPSLYEVFPCTLLMVLQSVWDQVVADAGNHGQTVANFNARLTDFIHAHATPEDGHELVQQFQGGRKSRELPVQSFWYRL